MLCGAIVAASPVSLRPRWPFAPTPLSPASALQAAMSIDHDDSNFIENGLLSYENPNYQLESALYGYEMHEDSKLLDSYGNLYIDNRRVEGDIESPKEKSNEKDCIFSLPNRPIFPDDSPPPEKECADQEDREKGSLPDSPYDEPDGSSDGIPERDVPHIPEGPDNDLYALPVKRRVKKELSSPQLPPGWEKHEDDDGPYYWHIKSGTIQRDPPPPEEPSAGKASGSSSVPRSTTSAALSAELDRRRKEELALKRRSLPPRADSTLGCVVRFFVRSLGWTEIAESELTPERSSRAVNKCIVDLSVGKNDLLDVVGRWGDGKDLFMDLDDGALKLIDPETLTTLHTQPIHTIRVWGVGRDNGRDFAYVARERTTRKHMCHVFRCEAPARSIANTLRDICKRIMIERTLAPARPTDLPVTRRPRHHQPAFPTPMEEPRKVVRARYLGSVSVEKPSGMDVLNDAMDRLSTARPPSAWPAVAVAVAPSTITVTEEGETLPIVECRVRYLSFLGIGRDVRRCAFIMHTPQDAFVAHAFHAEPSSGALCKTIEAACKLRYQKCLDAHGGNTGLITGTLSKEQRVSPPGSGSPSSEGSKVGLGAAIKSIVGSITGRRNS